MGARRKYPPHDAVKTIKRLASEGYELLGIAESFNVHIDLLNQWLEDEPKLSYAYEVGREIERQALHSIVFQAAKANSPANNNARFLLRSKHGYKDDEKASNTVNVAVAQNVLVVHSHGTDEEWEARAAEQQRELTLDAASPSQIAQTTETVTQTLPAQSYAPAAASAPAHPAYAAPTWKQNA